MALRRTDILIRLVVYNENFTCFDQEFGGRDFFIIFFLGHTFKQSLILLLLLSIPSQTKSESIFFRLYTPLGKAL